MPWFRTAEALSGKIYAPIFWVQECDGAGLGRAGDYQNVLGKVVGSEMEFGVVDVHAIDSGENIVYFWASQMRFMNIYMWFKQYYNREMHSAYSILTA